MRWPFIAVVLMVAAGAGVADMSFAQEGQNRVQRSIDGRLTRQLIVKALTVEPEPGGPAEVSLMLRIGFEFDSARLTAGARQDLDEVAAALSDALLVGARLTVEGHTDAAGSADYNLRLSRRRAEAVVAYLVRRGVAPEWLQPAGFGEYRLLPTYEALDDRQRRVEIVRTF